MENIKNKTLKEKVAYFVEQERKTRHTPETFLDFEHVSVARVFLKDYNETRDFLTTANAEELECFLSVLCDFIEKYPNEEIIQLCIDRKSQVGEFYTFDFGKEIEWAKKILAQK